MNPTNSTSELRLLAGVLLLAAGLLFAVTLADGSWSGGRSPFPFIWRDIALVHLGSAIPIGLLVGPLLPRSVLSLGLAGISLVAAGFFMLGSLEATCLSLALSFPFLADILRCTVAFALALGVLLPLGTIWPRSRTKGAVSWPRLSLSVAAMILLPLVYVDARARQHLMGLNDLMGQGRISEANLLAHRLLLLDTTLQQNGRPLTQVALELARSEVRLEAEVRYALPRNAPAQARLDRARTLAMLNRTEEALSVLNGVTDTELHAAADTLRGTIYESRRNWLVALGYYQRAREGWEKRAMSAERDAGQLRSVTGIAYCKRKQGDYSGAEAAYLEALALSPTADTHFLLAQFYEDAQDATKAHQHAERAMTLAPRRYQYEGEQLINQLRVRHFGCLSIPAR